MFKDCERYPPKAIVFGVTKSGTGALRMFLNAHPDIDNAPVKTKSGVWEKQAVNFFDLHYEDGVNWYIKQMPCSEPNRMVIDHTPQYFRKDYVPKRVYMFNSTMKLILIVREPISRTVSNYLQMSEGRSHFDKSLDIESYLLDKSGKQIDKESNAISTSSYVMHIRKWLKLFPLNQFYFIDGSELAKYPLRQLKELETFLGVRSYFNNDNVYLNETRGFYCVKLYYKEDGFQCGGSNKGRVHPQLTDKTYNLLKEHFDIMNERLFETIGKTFNWTTVKRGPLSSK